MFTARLYLRIAREWLKAQRLKFVWTAAIALLAAVGLLFAHQLGVMLFKAASITAFAVLGYLVYKSGFPVGPQDDPRVMTAVKAALIVGAMIAGALAL